MNPVALGIGIGLFASFLFMVIYAHCNFKIGTSYEEVFGRRIKL